MMELFNDATAGVLTPVQFVKGVGVAAERMDPGTVEFTYVLVGERGAVHFVYMDWHPLYPTTKRGIDTQFLVKFGHTLYPLASEAGYHSPIPVNEFHPTLGPQKCEWVATGECYGDGSSSRAAKWLTAWIGAGRDDMVLWAMLQNYYAQTFHGGQVESFDDMEFGEMLGLIARLTEGE